MKMPDLGGMKMPGLGDMTSAKWVKWGDDKRFILIGFIGDKVMLKQQQGL
jgi:hypothetical protein